MDELKQLLGDAYKEGMTMEEVGNFFKGKKFADLSTGNYVDKNKYDNTINDLNTKLTKANADLNNKLTDEERSAKEQEAKDLEIKNLKEMLKQSTLTGTKTNVNSALASTRQTLGVADNDKDFTSFIDNITSEDSAKSVSVANYVAKVVKDAYEKGKTDATKNAMGEFGNAKSQNGSASEIDSIGKRLAGLENNQSTFDYFK